MRLSFTAHVSRYVNAQISYAYKFKSVEQFQFVMTKIINQRVEPSESEKDKSLSRESNSDLLTIVDNIENNQYYFNSYCRTLNFNFMDKFFIMHESIDTNNIFYIQPNLQLHPNGFDVEILRDDVLENNSLSFTKNTHIVSDKFAKLMEEINCQYIIDELDYYVFISELNEYD